MREILLKLFWVIVLYFTPIHPLMMVIGIVIVLDTFFGRWAAKDKAKKEGKDVRLFVTSAKTRKGLVSKMITYQLAIILLFILDKYMLNDLLMYFIPSFPITYMVTKLVGVVLILVEFDSIDEKYYFVKGRRIKTLFTDKIKDIKRSIFNIKKFKDKIEEEEE